MFSPNTKTGFNLSLLLSPNKQTADVVGLKVQEMAK